jgi:hypothetical protein
MTASGYIIIVLLFFFVYSFKDFDNIQLVVQPSPQSDFKLDYFKYQSPSLYFSLSSDPKQSLVCRTLYTNLKRSQAILGF